MKLALSAVAALLLAFTASPVTAADTSHSFIAQASADWFFVQNDVAYGVHIVAGDELDKTPDANAQRLVGVNVQVLAAWYDPKTGEPVEALMVSEPYITTASSLSVNLRGADVKATVVVETPPEVAAAGGGGDGGGPHLGPFTLNVAASWAPTSGATHQVNNVWDNEAGVKTIQRTTSDTVEADATATITGDPILGTTPFGDLGVTQGSIGLAKLFKYLPPPMPTISVLSLLSLSSTIGRSTSWVRGAFASWNLNDARSTQVLLTVQQNHATSGLDSPPTARLEVIQSYCDTTTDTNVELDLFSDETTVTSGYVDSSIHKVAATITATVDGDMTLTPDCANPRFVDRTYQPYGPTQVTVTGMWTATGGVENSHTLFVEKGPGGSTRGQTTSRGIQASAVGSIAGPLANGQLTEVQNAFVYDERTRVAG
ncbi:MAG TPA: hypothetical protein VFB69_04325 [Candidatus Dormibacteraeota bacterium]|nr:hypothetical protein [Candidatus Dormibacteraeota bacterium]